MKIVRETKEKYEKPMGRQQNEPYYHRITVGLNDDVITIKKELYFLYGHRDHEGMDEINWYRDYREESCTEVVFKTHDLTKITASLEKKMIETLTNNFRKNLIRKIERLENLKNEVNNTKETLGKLENHFREQKLKRITDEN